MLTVGKTVQFNPVKVIVSKKSILYQTGFPAQICPWNCGNTTSLRSTLALTTTDAFSITFGTVMSLTSQRMLMISQIMLAVSSCYIK